MFGIGGRFFSRSIRAWLSGNSFQTRNGQRHAYWALGESYRTERGPRQRRHRRLTQPSAHQAILLNQLRLSLPRTINSIAMS
jgi:hypothetical protein